MAADRSAPSRRARRLVQGDDALFQVDGDHALDHADEHGLAIVALARECADLLVELLRHAVEALRDLGELERARHGELAGEVAGREAAGAVPDVAHLPADAHPRRRGRLALPRPRREAAPSPMRP